MSYTSKNWCALLLRGDECVEKKKKVRSLRVTFAQFSGRKEKKGVTKISRTLVREGICRRSESLFSLIYGCVLVVGFKQKKMVLRLLI